MTATSNTYETVTSNTYEKTTDFTSTNQNETTADVFSSASEAVTELFNTTANFISTARTPKEENQGLIIGLAVGIPCSVLLIVALAVVAFCFYKKRIPLPQIHRREHQRNHQPSPYETRINMSGTNTLYDEVGTSSSSEPVYYNVSRKSNTIYETTLPQYRN